MKIPKGLWLLLLCVSILSACGGGGGTEEGSASNKGGAKGSQWDSMNWDQGQWQ